MKLFAASTAPNAKAKPARRRIQNAAAARPKEAEGKLKAISADVSKVDAEAKQAMQQATSASAQPVLAPSGVGGGRIRAGKKTEIM